MILTGYIHEQSARNHRRDLLNDAERARRPPRPTNPASTRAHTSPSGLRNPGRDHATERRSSPAPARPA